jgi:hypothetical protein
LKAAEYLATLQVIKQPLSILCIHALLTYWRKLLLVIRGFDSSGNVIVNDPAGRDDSRVRRVYRRDEFARARFCSAPAELPTSFIWMARRRIAP